MGNILILGISGKLVGIDSSTGQVRWENGMKGGGYGEVGIAATTEYVFASAQSAKLFCLRYGSGEELWVVDTSSMGRATIVVEDDRVYVAKSGVVDCFTFDGSCVWTQRLEGKGFGRIAMGFPGNIVQADDAGTK